MGLVRPSETGRVGQKWPFLTLRNYAMTPSLHVIRQGDGVNYHDYTLLRTWLLPGDCLFSGDPSYFATNPLTVTILISHHHWTRSVTRQLKRDFGVPSTAVINKCEYVDAGENRCQTLSPSIWGDDVTRYLSFGRTNRTGVEKEVTREQRFVGRTINPVTGVAAGMRNKKR